MATIRNDALVTDHEDLQNIIEYLRGSEYETSNTYMTEMATIGENAPLTPPGDDEALSFQGLLDYLSEAESETITKNLDYYDRYDEAVTAETNLAEDILYDCGTCPTKQVSGGQMYCCLNCQRNTCSNCCLASEDGDLFCSQMCVCDWEDFLNYNETQTNVN